LGSHPLINILPFLSKGQKRVEGNARRTLQPLETKLLTKLYKKRSMGWLIALDEPVFPFLHRDKTIDKNLR
jgi:hypothetical protein